MGGDFKNSPRPKRLIMFEARKDSKMCDYSLMMVPNRLATEGEELVAHRFKSGTTGLVSCHDFDAWENRRSKSVWQRVKDSFSAEGGPRMVVCVPPGARLQLIGDAERLSEQFPGGLYGEAVFTQISAESTQHRDALSFVNGSTILLQLLPEGQKLKVVSMSSAEDPAPRIHAEFARSTALR